MRATLTVEGKEIEVYAIFYSEGKIHAVSIYDESGNLVTYYDINKVTKHYIEQPLKIDFATALKFPEFEARITERENKLIEHLEKMYERESKELEAFAYESFNSEDSPFERQVLEGKKREFKLMQQRILGLIDATEEVKAYLEGYYGGDNIAVE